MRPASSVRNSLSRVTTCEVLATESFRNPESLAGTSTLPGASTSRRFAVRTTAITVRMRLRLNASLWTITTGRRKPGSEPSGSPKSAHQTWPRSTTTILRRWSGPGADAQASRGGSPRWCTRGSVVRSSCDLGVWPGTRRVPWHRDGCETPQGAFQATRQNRRGLQGWTRPLSYRGNTTRIPGLASRADVSGERWEPEQQYGE